MSVRRRRGPSCLATIATSYRRLRPYARHMTTQSAVRAGVAVVLIASVATAAWAIAGRVTGGQVSEQIFATTSDAAQTSSRRWHSVPGLLVITDCHEDAAASADVSLLLGGASRRVEVRIVHDGYVVGGDEPVPMRPRSFVLDLRGEASSTHHLMFVKTRAADQHGERFRVQWRSLDSRRAVIRRGVMRLLWNPSEAPCR